jgi:hypothetical protein
VQRDETTSQSREQQARVEARREIIESVEHAMAERDATARTGGLAVLAQLPA